MMFLIVVAFGILGCVADKTVPYDAYDGRPLTDEEFNETIRKNTTFWCVTQFDDHCDPQAFRRLDGTCNNLKLPVRGSSHTPFLRMLPPAYDIVNGEHEPRSTKSGDPLPLSRRLRTELLLEGRRSDQKFTMLLTHFWVFMAAECTAIHDSVNYVFWLTWCCTEKGKTEHECAANYVPSDDPVLRYSDIRCLNMTRPESFQSKGCVRNGTVPERINSATPLYDGSMIYGSIPQRISEKLRLYEGGLLKYELFNGQIWPPSTPPNEQGFCFLNEPPHETRCHNAPDDTVNSILGINLNYIWFWRLHNLIATRLAEINPGWDDDKLFYTARDMNIAIMNQIYLYEMLASYFGKENLMKDGVLSKTAGRVDVYDENVLPQITLEYLYALRWAHIIQEGRLKMYDACGNYIKQMPITNLTTRTGYLALDHNLEYMTHGAYLQPCGAMNYAVDPDISGIGLGGLQRATDITTNDHAKGRYFGMAPYIQYLERCHGVEVKEFEDLHAYIAPERVEVLKEMYKDLEDIELMSGLWLENPIEGGFGPSTVYCIVVDQMIRNKVADRHWYESSQRPHAFTERQLAEIRKMTIASVLCEVGDGVTQIQSRAFERVGPGNKLTSCESIPKLDIRAWADA